MAEDPNRRCTCGFRRFREKRTSVETTVNRWMLFDSNTGGGFGATPFGIYFGSGAGGSGQDSWGEFTGTLRQTTRELVCENCKRIRLNRTLGSAAVFGAYLAEPYFYVALSDAQRPFSCYEIRLEDSSGVVLTAPLKFVPGLPPPIIADPPSNTAETPPAGADTVDTLLRARIPDVPKTASYLVTFIDRCSGTETSLVTVTLEEPPMILTTDQAELNGYPTLWLSQKFNTPTQDAAGATKGIPLDYCEAVIEYDARFGTVPSSQGWTHQAGAGTGTPGNYALVEGGVLRGSTPGGGSNPSYWEADEALSAAPLEVHGYATYLWETDFFTTNYGDGVDFQALFAANAGNYNGFRFTYRNELLYVSDMENGTHPAWSNSEYEEHGWHTTAGSSRSGDAELTHNGVKDRLGAHFGTQTGPASADEIRARFGDVNGEGITAFFKNFVVSTPGRFVRPWFRAIAPVADPKLRIYLIRDVVASGGSTIRLKSYYGAGTSSPYAIPGSTAEATVNLVDANIVYSVALDMTGISANQPFYFTLERDWTSSDETLLSTAWLLYATVRSS